MKKFNVYTLLDGHIVYEWGTDHLDRAVKAFKVMMDRATRQTLDLPGCTLDVVLDHPAGHRVLGDASISAHTIAHHTLLLV